MPKEETVKKEERIPVFIEKGSSREDQNLFISVNGKNFILPRGKTSTVPVFVYEEITRAERAQEKLDAFIEKKTGEK